MVENMVRWQMVLTEFVKDVLASPIQMVVATSAIFLTSIAAFAILYFFLQRFHNVSLVRYKNQTVIGSVVPLPAFQLSEALRKRIEVRVKNDLRLRDFVGASTNVAWQHFSQEHSLERQFPDSGTTFVRLRDITILGLSPTELIENSFRNYGLLKYKMMYRDNSFDVLFPIQVLQEYFQIRSVEDLQRRIQIGQLNPQEAALFRSLSAVAPKIRQQILEIRESQLFWLAERIKALGAEIEGGVDDKTRLTEIVYGQILSTMAPPGTQMEFDFNSLPLNPEPMDFVYMSTMLATSNVPSELVPITNDVRAAMWIQLMFSYFNLALLVAALVRLLKIG
jgi:hypothetical protein